MVLSAGLLACTAILVVWVDVKRYIACCSIVHMMFGMLGLWFMDEMLFVGMLLVVVLHSWCAMLLFWLAGLLYELGATRCVLMLAPSPVLLAL